MEADYAFAVQDVPGKGKGVVALLPFHSGDIVLAEAPLFVLRAEDLTHSSAAVISAISSCTSQERTSFYALHDQHAVQGTSKEQDIFETNALPCGADDTLQSGDATPASRGLFLLGARFNSSCVPNVSHSWDAASGRLVFRAVKDVQPGAELCIAYGDTLADREARRAELAARFGFVCRCEACALEGPALEESDYRRACLRGMNAEHANGVEGDPMEALGEVMLALRYLREEGLVACGTAFYRAGFTCCAAVSDYRSAAAWARQAYQMACLAFGEHKAEDWKHLMQDPKVCQQAGTLRRRTLAGPDAAAWSYLGLG